MAMMKSLQLKREKSLDVCMSPEMDRVYYPEAYVRGDQMPEIDKWDVGEEYTVTMKVRMRSYDKNETLEGTRSTACIELIAYEPVKKEKA